MGLTLMKANTTIVSLPRQAPNLTRPTFKRNIPEKVKSLASLIMALVS